MLYSAVAVAALGASTLVGAAPILNARKAAPTGWAHNVLEDYVTYHTRYLALSCYTQHNSTFFEDCCRPMRASQSVEEDRKEYCRPNATALESASARVAANAAVTASVSAIPADDAAPQWVQEAVNAASQSPSATAQQDFAAETTESAVPSSAPAPAATEETTTQAKQEEAQPTTTTTTVEEPKWTPEPKPTTTTTEEKPKETESPSSGGGGGSGATYFGQATWYKQSEGADPSNKGSCGKESSDSDYVVAISTVGSSWGNTKCFQNVEITNIANGKKVTAQIVDNCPSCRDANSLDLSPPAFAAIADPNDGVTEISWQFV